MLTARTTYAFIDTSSGCKVLVGYVHRCCNCEKIALSCKLLTAETTHFYSAPQNCIVAVESVVRSALVPLTLSPPILLRLYTLPYWSNPPFLIFDIQALWRSFLSARMSKIKNGGLDQYGAGPLEQQQLGTAGVERVNTRAFLADRPLCDQLPISSCLG